MKQISILIFAFLFFPTFKAEAQRRVHWTDSDTIKRWTDFDTIKVYNDRIHVGYQTFSDSKLTEEGQAFLYPRIRKIRYSMWLPRFISIKVPADSMVLHGTVTTKLSNGKYRIGRYDSGKKNQMTYFDFSGEEILEQEFYPGRFYPYLCVDCGDPEQGHSKYFYYGPKKSKKHSPTKPKAH